jgi:RsiW-degrading membrane proteinase PrsW (M82 family)
MKQKIFFLLILLLGFLGRFYGLNWDANNHLHPDERFLTMVAMAMKLPVSWNSYFDPQKSLLNPFNVGYNFFVYVIFLY